MSKALESAVKAFQLYGGSAGLPVRVQQRLYDRAMKKARSIAASKGMDEGDVADQLGREAARRGVIIPRPGKDY